MNPVYVFCALLILVIIGNEILNISRGKGEMPKFQNPPPPPRKQIPSTSSSLEEDSKTPTFYCPAQIVTCKPSSELTIVIEGRLIINPT